MVLSPTVFRNYLFVMIKRILAELTEYACEMAMQVIWKSPIRMQISDILMIYPYHQNIKSDNPTIYNMSIRRLVNETINPATQCIILKIVGFQVQLNPIIPDFDSKNSSQILDKISAFRTQCVLATDQFYFIQCKMWSTYKSSYQAELDIQCICQNSKLLAPVV